MARMLQRRALECKASPPNALLCSAASREAPEIVRNRAGVCARSLRPSCSSVERSDDRLENSRDTTFPGDLLHGREGDRGANGRRRRVDLRAPRARRRLAAERARRDLDRRPDRQRQRVRLARSRTTRSASSPPRPTTSRPSATSTTGTSSSSRTSSRTCCTPITSAASRPSSTPSSARRSRPTRCSRAGSSRASPSSRRARKTSRRTPALVASGTCSCAPTCSRTTSRRSTSSRTTARRWPQGNLWYLYGSFFMQWIAETYGEQAIRTDDRRLRAPAHPVRHQSLDAPRDRAHLRRALPRVDRHAPKRDFGAQAAAVRRARSARGNAHHLRRPDARSPRASSRTGAWSGAAGDVVYYRDDGHDTPGLYHVPLRRDAKGALVAPTDATHELFVRTLGDAVASFTPDGAHGLRLDRFPPEPLSRTTTSSSCRGARRARPGLEGNRGSG